MTCARIMLWGMVASGLFGCASPAPELQTSLIASRCEYGDRLSREQWIMCLYEDMKIMDRNIERLRREVELELAADLVEDRRITEKILIELVRAEREGKR